MSKSKNKNEPIKKELRLKEEEIVKELPYNDEEIVKELPDEEEIVTEEVFKEQIKQEITTLLKGETNKPNIGGKLLTQEEKEALPINTRVSYQALNSKNTYQTTIGRILKKGYDTWL